MSIVDKELDEYKLIYAEDINRIKNERIFITGSSGLIGTAIYQLLRDDCSKIYNYHHTESLERMLNEFNPSIIFHCGAITKSADFVERPVEVIDSIINPTKIILDYCKNSGCKLIYLSSLEVYGIVSRETVTEKSELYVNSNSVRNSYPTAKIFSEQLCTSYREEFGVDVKVARIASTFGLFNKEDDGRIFNKIVSCLISNNNLVLNSDGSSKKDVIYTLDCVGALLKLLLSDICVCNISSDEFYSIRLISEMAFRNFNGGCEVIVNDDASVSRYLANSLNFHMDNSLIKSLGWKPLRSIMDIFKIEIIRRCKNDNSKQ